MSSTHSDYPDLIGIRKGIGLKVKLAENAVGWGVDFKGRHACRQPKQQSVLRAREQQIAVDSGRCEWNVQKTLRDTDHTAFAATAQHGWAGASTDLFTRNFYLLVPYISHVTMSDIIRDGGKTDEELLSGLEQLVSVFVSKHPTNVLR